MADIEIIEAKRIPSLVPDRRGKTDRMVFYSTGPGQTFMLVLPDEGLTEAAVREAVRKDQETRGQLVGKKFTV